MSKRLSIAASLILACSLILTACSGAKTTTPAATATAKPQKPALTVPAHFDSMADEKTFAIQAVDKGYYREATPLLEAVVSATPDAEGYAQLGTARYNTKNYTGAVEAWTKVGELAPARLAEMQNNIGNALRDAKKYTEAEAAYRKALDADPTRWMAATNLATMLKGEKKVDEAIAVLKEAAAVNKDIPPVTSLLASMQQNTATP